MNNPPLPLANLKTPMAYTTVLPEEVLVEAKTNFPGTRSSQINNGSSISATRLKLPLEDGKKERIYFGTKRRKTRHTPSPMRVLSLRREPWPSREKKPS